MEAEFSGVCGICTDKIEQGEEIERHPDGEWCHVSCLEDEEAELAEAVEQA